MDIKNIQLLIDSELNKFEDFVTYRGILRFLLLFKYNYEKYNQITLIYFKIIRKSFKDS